jgi:NAD-dependent histone deacetylase SIR2
MFIGGEAPNCVECIELESVREVVGKRCQGIGRIRPRIVLYNEDNPDGMAIGSVSLADISARPDGLVVVGTTLKIPGVRRLVREMSQAVHSANGAVVWLNVDSPPSLREFDGCFDMIVKGDCQVIPQLLKDYNIEVKAKLEQEAQAKLLRKEKAELKAKEKLKQKTLEDHFKVTKKTVTTNKKIVTNT